MLLSIPNSPEADQLVNLLCLSCSYLWGVLERLNLPVTQTFKTKNAQLYLLTWYISCLIPIFASVTVLGVAIPKLDDL